MISLSSSLVPAVGCLGAMSEKNRPLGAPLVKQEPNPATDSRNESMVTIQVTQDQAETLLGLVVDEIGSLGAWIHKFRKGKHSFTPSQLAAEIKEYQGDIKYHAILSGLICKATFPDNS